MFKTLKGGNIKKGVEIETENKTPLPTMCQFFTQDIKKIRQPFLRFYWIPLFCEHPPPSPLPPFLFFYIKNLKSLLFSNPRFFKKSQILSLIATFSRPFLPSQIGGIRTMGSRHQRRGRC